MEEKLSDKVLEKIINGHVKMKSCGYFKALSVWWLFVGGVFFLLASLAVSLGFYYIDAHKPASMLAYKPLFFISTIPYFYVLLAVVFLFLAARAYRRSRNMCRHEEWMLFAALVLGSFLIGSALFSARLDKSLRLALEEKETYKHLVMTPKYFWSQPHKGTLSGVVVEKKQRDAVVVKCWDGSKWNVLILDEKDISPEKTDVRSVVKMIGEQGVEENFVAWKVWRWN